MCKQLLEELQGGSAAGAKAALADNCSLTKADGSTVTGKDACSAVVDAIAGGDNIKGVDLGSVTENGSEVSYKNSKTGATGVWTIEGGKIMSIKASTV